MVNLVPAILATNPEDYQTFVEKLNNAQSLKEGWVHIDFMDNKFVPNLSIGAEETANSLNDFKKEAHLMVEHPLEWIDALKSAGYKRAIFHFESKDPVRECVEEIKKAGLEVGIALKDETPVDMLASFVGTIDVVLLMGVEPGFQGQPFIPGVYKKVRQIKESGYNVKVAVDGHVDDKDARELVLNGVDELVIGSFLFKGDVEENVEKIWEAVNS